MVASLFLIFGASSSTASAPASALAPSSFHDDTINPPNFRLLPLTSICPQLMIFVLIGTFRSLSTVVFADINVHDSIAAAISKYTPPLSFSKMFYHVGLWCSQQLYMGNGTDEVIPRLCILF